MYSFLTYYIGLRLICSFNIILVLIGCREPRHTHRSRRWWDGDLLKVKGWGFESLKVKSEGLLSNKLDAWVILLRLMSKNMNLNKKWPAWVKKNSTEVGERWECCPNARKKFKARIWVMAMFIYSVAATNCALIPGNMMRQLSQYKSLFSYSCLSSFSYDNRKQTYFWGHCCSYFYR